MAQSPEIARITETLNTAIKCQDEARTYLESYIDISPTSELLDQLLHLSVLQTEALNYMLAELVKVKQ
ncbi:MAG: hypothetical protein WC551_11600 [Patescibacteria group bacterium]